MAILKIARMGHPVLTRRADRVEDPGDPEIARLAGDMIETMLDAEGIGLAAPQVHGSLRLIVFSDAGARDEVAARAPVVLINPEVLVLDETPEVGFEGCLSIPGIRGLVPRPARIGYRGLDLRGRTVEREADGLHARVVLHEVDHLDGVLYLDRMPDLKRLTFQEEMRHFSAETGGG